MTANPSLVIVVKPAPDRRRLPQVVAWLRVLVPSALLLVAPAMVPDYPDAEVIQVDCAEGLDGPLSLASVLARHVR